MINPEKIFKRIMQIFMVSAFICTIALGVVACGHSHNNNDSKDSYGKYDTSSSETSYGDYGSSSSKNNYKSYGSNNSGSSHGGSVSCRSGFHPCHEMSNGFKNMCCKN